MCGITGIINLDDDEINFSLLKKMSGCLSHRGPDESGFFLNNNVGLANTRLSIVDIEGGHQPFISYDKKVVVIQNGEIYNYREIKKELENSKYECKTSSDTEVILRLYEKFSDLNKGWYNWGKPFNVNIPITAEKAATKTISSKVTGIAAG